MQKYSFAQVYVFAYAKVYTLYKTYSFAYAKYIVCECVWLCTQQRTDSENTSTLFERDLDS